MEASLTCAVCLSVFENPTTLPVCSHNFCKKCILECVTKSFSYGLDYGGGGGSSNNIWKNSQLECPLCRKSNFIAEGAVNMPGNTTLAEVVKLFRSQQLQLQLAVGGERETEPLEPLAGGTRAPGGDDGERELCQRHPHRKLQLFCKVCKQLACGQCVSEDHRGVFHAVNLVDMIYQEEKLEYFNNLRELRQLNNRLKVEIADSPSDLEYVLDYDKEIIITKIDRILEKVELKKRQLIDEIEKKKKWKERERKARLERKRTQKKTIEEYLKECEKLVNECNPVNFLKVACDLNDRVKSNLAIVLPTLEKHNELTCLQPHQFLVKPVLDSISALQLTKDTEKPNSILDTGSTASELHTDGYQFKTTLKMWKQPKEFKEPKFVPEIIFEYGCHDQIWCISAKEDHQNMSPEELRYKHYQSYRKDWNCFVTEGYADSENSLEPSLSSVPVELLKTPDGVQKPHVKLFSFGQSIKKVKKKFRGNLYVPLPPNSGSTASIPSVSNSEMSSSCAFEKSLVEDKKQKHDPVPPPSVQSETVSSNTSTVENLPTAAVTASLPVTLSLCSTMASSDKTGECQQKLFSSGAIDFAVSKCSSSPSKQKESSISNVGIGFLKPTVTCASSPSSKLPSSLTFADTLANKLKDQQALATSTSFTFEKPGSCCFIRIPTSTSTSVLHNKTICESTGKHTKHQNSQTSCSTSSTGISKVLLDSNGTSSSFLFGKWKEQCSQESSPKPDLFNTSGFLSGQVKPAASFSFFNSGTGTLDFSSEPFPSIKSTTKPNESLRNTENPACLRGSTVGRDVASPFKFLQVPRSNVPTLNEEQFLSTTSRSTTPGFDFKLANSGIITSASSLFTSPSSGSSTSSRTLCEQSCVTSQSGFNPLKHVASSAETSSIFTRTNSIGSNSMVFTPAFGQEPTYSITQQQSTATLDSVTKVKEMSTSGLSISAEKVALRNCKGLTPITPPDIARDVPDLVTLIQVSRNDIPNLNEKPFLSTVGRSKSPSSDFKIENPDIVLSPPFLLASPSFVSTYSNSSSLSTPVAQNVLPTQNSTKPLNLFARCVETTSVCSRANSICSNAVTSLNQGCTPTVSQQQNTVRPADVAKVNEIQTSELSIYVEPSTFNRAHSSGLNCKDSSPVVNQKSSEKVPTDIGIETHKLKETLLAETLTSEPEIFHRIESANSRCVDFAAGFNKGLPSISTQQTQVPFVDDAIKTCKTKSVEVPKSTQQSVIGKIPFSQLGNATSIPENPLGGCSSDADEEGKNPPIFGEQDCNTQISHVTENQGSSDDHQSSVVTSEMEYPDSLTAKESPYLSRRRWKNIEPLNLSHTGDSACIPQSIASVASSFAEASNGNAQEDIKRIATDCSFFTATSPVFSPVFKFGADNDFQFTLGTSNLTNSTELQEKNEDDCLLCSFTVLPSPPPVNDPASILDAENVLFSNRGKLYCFERMSLQWKERAFGEIRVLEDKITKLSRLVMWNATNKCCANHWITRDLELKHAKTSNRIWTWHALDYSENKQVLVEFAVHFKLKEMAQLFKQVIETVQSTTGIAELTKQKNDQNGNDGHTSLGASELKQGGKFLREMEEQEEDGDDVVMLSEVKPTPEQRALALELFLPPTFFCYKNRPGYQSSDDEEDSFETAVKKLYPNYNKFM